MFTEAQLRLIGLCKSDGYGAALFAISVERSGRCSEQQFLTMQQLHSASVYRRKNKTHKKIKRQVNLDCAFSVIQDGGEWVD